MKKLILSILLLSISFVAISQSMYGDQVKADVKMKYVYSFEEALEKSKKENKPIFFNCFADWVLTCHGMNLYVFSDQDFADWCDENFVNLFIDVTKDEGKALADKYGLITFPQYLILDKRGDIIQRIIGGGELAEFKEKLSRSLNEKTTHRWLQKRYESGKRDVNTLRDYAIAQFYAGDINSANDLTNQYFEKIKSKEWRKKENWFLFQRYVFEKDSPMFIDLIANKDKYVEEIGAEAIDKYISMVYSNYLMPYATTEKHDMVKLIDFYIELKDAGLADTNQVFLLYEIAKIRSGSDMKSLISFMKANENAWENPQVPYMINLSLGQAKGLDDNEKRTIADYLIAESKKAHESISSKYKQIAEHMLNTSGVKFEEGTFKEALAKAKESKKLLFLDCYTTWCGPCIQMSTQVFTQKVVGDYFNKNFVNIKMDMEAGEGIELAKKYKVTSFPTLLLIDGNGKVVHKIVGGRSAQALISEMEAGVTKHKK